MSSRGEEPVLLSEYMRENCRGKKAVSVAYNLIINYDPFEKDLKDFVELLINDPEKVRKLVSEEMYDYAAWEFMINHQNTCLNRKMILHSEFDWVIGVIAREIFWWDTNAREEYYQTALKEEAGNALIKTLIRNTLREWLEKMGVYTSEKETLKELVERADNLKEEYQIAFDTLYGIEKMLENKWWISLREDLGYTYEDAVKLYRRVGRPKFVESLRKDVGKRFKRFVQRHEVCTAKVDPHYRNFSWTEYPRVALDALLDGRPLPKRKVKGISLMQTYRNRWRRMIKYKDEDGRIYTVGSWDIYHKRSWFLLSPKFLYKDPIPKRHAPASLYTITYVYVKFSKSAVPIELWSLIHTAKKILSEEYGKEL